MQNANDLVFVCPHCNDNVIINIREINCGIFRHAYYKNSMQQIPPHESKDNCDKLVQEEMIFGCAKPFQIVKENDEYIIRICDYI